jgi:hypothetical protein
VSTRFWIKLYIEILDDPKMGRLPNHLWRRAVELFLLAGRQGNDGALPPVEEMAWILRLSPQAGDKLLEDLHGLAEVGIVHACASTAGTGEAEPGKWMVTHFAKWQAAIPVDERVRQFRERNGGVTKDGTRRYKRCNEVEVGPSTSTSPSESLEEQGLQEQGETQRRQEVPRSEDPLALPTSPAEAMQHPDVRVFAAVTGGRIPGLSQYQTVIGTVRFLRAREKLDDAALQAYLAPYWLAWSSRKRLDGRPYDPGNITWLAEWAVNGSIPTPGGSKATESVRPPVPSPQETRRMLDEQDEKLKQAVPMPEEVRERMRGLVGQLAGKEPP